MSSNLSDMASDGATTDLTGSVPGPSAELAGFVAALRPGDLPPDARASAAVSLLDGVGVSLAASALGEGCDAFAGLVAAEGGSGDATVIGVGGRVPAASAALANGAMAHALDFEDSIDGVAVHPHAQVLPAVLALAEQRDLAGDRLLAAIALGCDLTVRLGRAAGDAMSDRGWYPPPVLGGFGATAACAFLVGLAPRQVLDALSLALMQITASGEIKHSPESVIRGVRDGFAAHAAVRAVQLAERGVRGFDRPLEGDAGFLAAFAGAQDAAWAVVDGLGASWAGVETSYKAWPSCRGTHAFVQAALEMRRQVRVDSIRDVELIGAPVNEMLARPLAAKQRPTTAIDAKFSLPFTVASALVHGGITLASFSPSALESPEVLSVAQRVRFVSDPTGRLGMTSGIMRITTDAGTVEVAVERPRGNPLDPLPVDELRAKFVACAGQAVRPIPEAAARARADEILAAGRAPAVREPIARWLAA